MMVIIELLCGCGCCDDGSKKWFSFVRDRFTENPKARQKSDHDRTHTTHTNAFGKELRNIKGNYNRQLALLHNHVQHSTRQELQIPTLLCAIHTINTTNRLTDR